MLSSAFKFKENRMCFMYSYSPKFSVTRIVPESIFKASIADPVCCICVCFHMLKASYFSLFHSFYILSERSSFSDSISISSQRPHIMITNNLLPKIPPLQNLICCSQEENRTNKIMMTNVIFTFLFSTVFFRALHGMKKQNVKKCLSLLPMSRTMPS